MIHIDIDGVLIDFIGTAKKFGIEVKTNEFGKWKWSEPPFPSPEEFYAKAELQPWFEPLIFNIIAAGGYFIFLTADFAEIKKRFILEKINNDIIRNSLSKLDFIESDQKSNYCDFPIDMLIDDCAANCEAWRKKGGVAWHFDFASETPFEDFLKYWRR